MFADDTTSYNIGNEVETIVDALNSISVDPYKWCQRNYLTLHGSRTTSMPFIEPMRDLKYGESSIQFCEQSRCLGVIIDSKLSWKPQISAVHAQFVARLKQLKSLKGLPSKVLEEIYHKAIISTVSYCISIWGTSYVSLLKLPN